MTKVKAMSEAQENFENAAMQEQLDNDAEYLAWVQEQELPQIEYDFTKEPF